MVMDWTLFEQNHYLDKYDKRMKIAFKFHFIISTFAPMMMFKASDVNF